MKTEAMETKKKRGKQPRKCIIQYKNYEFMPADVVPDRFDLYEKIGKTKKLIGYGYRFEQALDKLTRLELSKQDIHDIKTYCQEYNKAVKEIKDLLK